MAGAKWVFGKKSHLEAVEVMSQLAARVLGKHKVLGPLPWPASPWTRARDLKMPAKQTFRAWWKKNRGPEAGPDQNRPRQSTGGREES